MNTAKRFLHAPKVPETRNNHAFVPDAECLDEKETLLSAVSTVLRQQPTQLLVIVLLLMEETEIIRLLRFENTVKIFSSKCIICTVMPYCFRKSWMKCRLKLTNQCIRKLTNQWHTQQSVKLALDLLQKIQEIILKLKHAVVPQDSST